VTSTSSGGPSESGDSFTMVGHLPGPGVTEKRLNQFRGALDAAGVALGINAAKANARRLLEDAKLLLEAGRYAGAASSAILAIEEAGKASILRGLILERDSKELAEGWRQYRSHTKKNVSWIMPRLVASGARKLDDMRPIFDEISDHPHLLDQVKQIAFYTDCLGEAHWSEPSQVIDSDLARSLVQTAEILAKSRDVTTREMELWVKHMAPVWKRDIRVDEDCPLQLAP
jgi:AbiV family abortive infection protein